MVDQEDPFDQNLNSLSITGSDDDHDKKAGGRCWSALPTDILELVLPNLLWKDSIRFGATCKNWSPVTTYFPPPVDSALSHLPYLMRSKAINCKFFQPLNSVIYEEKIPRLEGARVRHSAWGWLLLSQGYHTQFFFNPSNKAVIRLPDVPGKWWDSIADVCFTHPPTSPDCTVVAFRHGGLEVTKVGIIRRGQGSWTMKEFKNNKEFNFSNAGIVMNNGNLYCLGEAGNIGELDLSEQSPSLSWNICTKPLFNWPCELIQHMFAVKCDEGMLAVFVMDEERKVKVKRFRLPEMVWEDVENLKDQAVYLSHGGSFVVKMQNELMANKIYFTMLYGKSGVSYSLKTREYQSIDGKCSCKTRLKFLIQESSYWFQASYAPVPSLDFIW